MALGLELPKDAKNLYIVRRRKDLELLKSALEQKATSEFVRVGHQLKGNASTFGFLELESLGKELEKVGDVQDWALAGRLLHQFEQWLSRESQMFS